MNAMEIFLLVILTVCAAWNSFAEASRDDKTFYEDLAKRNISCPNRDTCYRSYTGSDFPYYLCTCDKWCSRLGTCCIDSPHRGLYPTMEPTCRTVGDICEPPYSFYMVDRCGASGDTNPQWQSLCEGESKDDIMKIAPVTSLATSVTYKNYFCFRCHESTEDFFYWTAKFYSPVRSHSHVDPERFSVMYDLHDQWVAVDGNGTTIKVKLIFEVPYGKHYLAVPCPPNVISECSESWTDENIRNLCKAYAATVCDDTRRNGRAFKNVHCAICNFFKVSDLDCFPDITKSCYTPMSFEKLIDVNSVGGNEKCEENFVWDPRAKKCIKFGCNMPGHVVKNGVCVPP